MPLIMPTVIFDVPIASDEQSQGIIDRGLMRIGKRFKRHTQRKMEDGPHTGRIYRRRRGEGFTRGHQASAVGEHPAPDTGNLVRSVEDKKAGKGAHEVYVDNDRAHYGPILESPRFERVIMGDEMIQEFIDGEMIEELERMHGELVR